MKLYNDYLDVVDLIKQKFDTCSTYCGLYKRVFNETVYKIQLINYIKRR